MKKILCSIFVYLFIVSSSYGQEPYNVKGLVIFIDYSDAPAWVTPERLDGLINGLTYSELGVSRSVRAYWLHNTRGKIDFTSDIFFYRAPQTKAYYDTQSNEVMFDMWRAALESVVTNHPEFDWNSLTVSDSNKIPNGFQNGFFQSIHFITSEKTTGFGGTGIVDWKAPNGVHMQKVSASWLQAPWESTARVETICHEMTHGLFGIPDLYDNDGSSEGVGIYAEAIAAPHLAQFGWCDVIKPTGVTQRITLVADGGTVVQCKKPNSTTESFTIEARKKSNLGNSDLSSDIGLIIWHTDNLVTTSNMLENMTFEEHFRYSVEQADGKFDLERGINKGDSGDMYIPGRSFTNATTPNSKWWDGTESGFSISNITIDGDNVSFDLNGPAQADNDPLISQSGWTLKYVDSVEGGGDPGKNAFDGDPFTIWHTQWGDDGKKHPHEIQINLNDTYSLSALEYTPRQVGGNGRIGDYEIYVSMDGEDWGTAVAEGTWVSTEEKQTVFFEAKLGRYIRVVALSEANDPNNPWTTIAEINLYGVNSVLSTQTIGAKENNIKAYPIPTKGILNLQIPAEVNGNVEISVLDTAGKLIQNKTVNTSASRALELDLKQLSKGLYIVRLKSNSSITKNIKVIVE